MGASTTANDHHGAVATEARDDTRDTAALVTIDDHLATIATGTNMDSHSIASTAQCEGNTIATRSLVRVLVKATVRRHTRVTYVRLDGSHDDESEGEAASLGAAAPELLLRSELSFVMSSSVLLPSPSHNYG